MAEDNKDQLISAHGSNTLAHLSHINLLKCYYNFRCISRYLFSEELNPASSTEVRIAVECGLYTTCKKLISIIFRGALCTRNYGKSIKIVKLLAFRCCVALNSICSARDI